MRGARCVIPLTLSLLGCGGPHAVEWHEEGAYRWRELVLPRRGSTGFTQLPASRTGLGFSNTLTQDQMIRNRHLVHGSGVALGDVDGDGLVDVFLGRLDGPNALYRNLGDWRFADIADQAGVSVPDRFTTGAVFADVDGDGDLDLLLTALGGPNALFVNDGTGRFAERREEAGLASQRGSTTLTLADVDGDGDLDLYIANYKVATVRDLVPPDQLTFERVVQRREERYEIVPEFRDHYRTKVIPGEPRAHAGALVTRIERAEPDWFYLNDGTGRFEPVAWTSGRFLDENGNPLAREPDYFTLAARFYDIDGDGDPDLYVCNDFTGPDQFWLNDGTGTFQAVPRVAQRTSSNAAMAVDFADIDRDGDVDFFEVDMLSRDPRHRKMQLPTHTALPKAVGAIEDRPQMQRNTLFVNRGDGTFAQAAEFAGIEASDWSWATLFLDVDLDGYEDILITTGHTWDVMDSDTHERTQNLSIGGDWHRVKLLFPKLHLKNVAFRNNGDLTFDEVGEAWGFAAEEDISHGIAAGDLDGDGDLDVVVNRLGSPVAVLRNDATAPRVAVRLLGRAPNTQAVGAKIRVSEGTLPEQQKEVTVGGTYLSGSDPLYVFAAGDAHELTIVVDWRSGAQSIVRGVRPNRLYEIREAAATPRPNPEAAAGGGAAGAADARGTPWFTDLSAQLGHGHVDTPFDDHARQPLLPNRLSQLGPGVSWYDVDRDGYEDLLLPSGRGGRLSLYLNHAGRLTRVALGLQETRYDQTTVLAVPDGTGGAALLVGQASYEARTPSEATAVPAVLRVGLGAAASRAPSGPPTVTAAVPGDNSSVGPLALADVDGDGDLDLFVGGRVIPVAYPIAASSRLFQNDGRGQFAVDEANRAVFSSVGLVSAAVFSDIDGDGDPDLLLAVEWGPLRLFRNDAGRFVDATEAWGLASYPSRWNGLTTGDLNDDGRLDIVATSWGRNTRYRLDTDHPLLLYYGDFDRNGTLDLLEAQFDERRGGIVPLETLFSRLTSAIPATRLRVRSARAFADATLEDLLGPGLAAARRLKVTTFSHMVFLNRGTTFEARPLPMEAQLAPAFYAGVADADGDGHEDLFLSQNFFPTETGTPRYDAGRALWLKGDGSGTLVAVPGQVSGIAVYGDQRGAALADYNADGRVDLVVSQNGAQTKLYRNDGARPGLRVRLRGTPENPDAVGAVMRLVYPDGRGPAREIHAGSGYWSQDGAVQVLGVGGQPTAVWVRWPGGAETEVPIQPGMREITIRMEQ